MALQDKAELIKKVVHLLCEATPKIITLFVEVVAILREVKSV